MAGLPKRMASLCLRLLLASIFATAATADDIQSPSVILDPPVQTLSDILQPMIELVEANVVVPDEEKQLLIDAFADVIEQGLLTADGAVEMLLTLGWADLSLEKDVALALSLLNDTLEGIASGEIEDPVSALIDAYTAAMTPDGIVNALTKANATEETILQAESLVASGIPPGIVLRITKFALREDEITQEEIAAILDALAAASADGASPGQAANAATGNGSYRHTEQEQEENANQTATDDPEQEENKNGPRKTGKNEEKDKGGKKD
jgi:hypothetical protein